MSDTGEPQKKLKIVSLEPKVTIIQQISGDSIDISDDSDEDAFIVAPGFLDEKKVIENISELIDTVYDQFNQACTNKNLNWEAELELGMEFGVKFTAKLKISPKPSQETQ